jgi:hypothetical protein
MIISLQDGREKNVPYWTSNGQAGCVFANKVSITFEPNKAYYQTQMIKPVMVKDKLGTSVLEDYVYLIAYSNNKPLGQYQNGQICGRHAQ